VTRRRLIGFGLGLLAAVLLGALVLLFALLVGSALAEEPADGGHRSRSLGVGFLVAGAGFLAALVGAILVLASARTASEAPAARRPGGAGIALRVVGFLVASGWD